MAADAVVARGLVKHYGPVKAVDELDVTVPEGGVLGLLGPAGAGKTTTTRMLTTLTIPDAGEASILGHDVLTESDEVRRVIGVSGEQPAVDDHLTGIENLEMFGLLRRMSKSRARERAEELLDRLHLDAVAQQQVKTYSDTMYRRLDLAAALIGEPQVLFLDEPTVGLTPRNQMNLWDVVNDLVTEGTTVVLATQQLQEADELADRIIVLDHGSPITTGTPDELKREVGGERLDITMHSKADAAAVVRAIDALAFADYTVDPEAHRLSIPVRDGPAALFEAVRRLDAVGIEPAGIGVHQPTLDDIFVSLTGRTTPHPDEEAS